MRKIFWKLKMMWEDRFYQQPKSYNIWVEGFCCSGMENGPEKARCLARDVYGINFIDACLHWYCEKGKEGYGDLSYDGKYLALWGCRLFDNEKDARKSFG